MDTYQQIKEHLSLLGLEAMSQVLPEHLDKANKAQISYSDFLCELLGVETDFRLARRQESLRCFAGFPANYSLSDYDFSAQKGLDKKVIDDLATMRFVKDASNILFIGPPGVGKTMLAVGLGHKAIELGYKTIYVSAADLVAKCHKAVISGKWELFLRSYVNQSLLIIDELGYLPLGKEGASYLFEIVSRRYLRGSIILTTNQPISSWGEVVSDTVLAAALLDRLLHRCTVVNIQGESYRMRGYREQSKLLRKAVANTKSE